MTDLKIFLGRIQYIDDNLGTIIAIIISVIIFMLLVRNYYKFKNEEENADSDYLTIKSSRNVPDKTSHVNSEERDIVARRSEENKNSIDNKMKECFECKHLSAVSAKFCPFCGYRFL